MMLFYINSVSISKKITLLTISLIGLFVFDVAFATVVINYAIQCQLIVYLLDGICTRTFVNSTDWKIENVLKVYNQYKHVCFNDR